MRTTFAVAAALITSLPLAAQVTTTGTTPSTTGGVTPAAGASTIAGPAGAGTVTVPPTAVRPTTPVGRTFSRPVLGAPPLTPSTLGTSPGADGFPPPVGTVSPIVTNTGIGGFVGGSTFNPPEASTFPPGPTTVGNTVGQNFVAPATNFPPRRALSVNLPPGATVQRNEAGIPEPFIPPATIPTTPGNTIGAPSGPEVGTGTLPSSLTRPPVAAPRTPVTPPPVRNPGARPPAIPRP